MGLININKELVKFLAEKNRKGMLKLLAPILSHENIQVVTKEHNRAGELLFDDTDNHMGYPLWLERRAQGHFDDLPFRPQGRNVATILIQRGADMHIHEHGMRILAMAPRLRVAAIDELIRLEFPNGRPKEELPEGEHEPA